MPGKPLVVLIGVASRARATLVEALDDEVVLVTASSLSEFLRTVGEAGIAGEPAGELHIAPGLVMDFGCRQVLWRDEHLHVTRREFELLAALSREPRQAMTFEELLTAGWGDADHRDVGLVHSAVMRLRSKMLAVGVPVHVASVWGVGFRLAEGPNPGPAR